MEEAGTDVNGDTTVCDAFQARDIRITIKINIQQSNQRLSFQLNFFQMG